MIFISEQFIIKPSISLIWLYNINVLKNLKVQLRDWRYVFLYVNRNSLNYWVISNNDITIKICFNTFLVKLRRSIIVIKIHHWSICVFSYFYRNFSWNKKKSILSLYTKYNVHQFVVSHIFIGISIYYWVGQQVQ
jgi:hypothetical protein